MRKTYLVFALALTSLCAPAAGSILTYTEQAIATGAFHGTSFTNALLTITLTGDTASITNPSPGVFVLTAPTTVSVAGLGSGIFTDVVRVVVNQNGSIAGFGDASNNDAILFGSNSGFATYNLSTAIGPLSGPAQFNDDTFFDTTAGTLVLAATTATFTATTVPEPSECIPGLLSLVGIAIFARPRGTASVQS